MSRRPLLPTAALLPALLLAACGPASPTDVELGETTLVVVVNPTVDAPNNASVPAPGSARSALALSVDDGPSATTDAAGVAVLARVPAGRRTLRLPGGASLQVDVVEGTLREVAVALSGSSAQLMAEVPYGVGQTVVEVTPSTPPAEVNAALNRSNALVLFRGGTYRGDLTFNGSNTTLFGEGPRGGTVTLEGNVTVNGSASRIRGARVTGTLSLKGSDNGLSFSRVSGRLTSDGSDVVLLGNQLCGGTGVTGSSVAVLGNTGAAPLAAPAGGC
jgi:hypothetical protein